MLRVRTLATLMTDSDTPMFLAARKHSRRWVLRLPPGTSSCRACVLVVLSVDMPYMAFVILLAPLHAWSTIMRRCNSKKSQQHRHFSKKFHATVHKSHRIQLPAFAVGISYETCPSPRSRNLLAAVCMRRSGGGAGQVIEAVMQAVPEEGGQIELHNVRHNQCILMHRMLWAKKLVQTTVFYLLHADIPANMSRRPSVLVYMPT